MLATPTDPLISDTLLHTLANPVGNAVLGEWDAETRAMLATAIPEMAVELLRLRNQVRRQSGALILKRAPIAADMALSMARQTIRAPGPVGQKAMTAACETLLLHATNAAERHAAADVLAQMQRAA